MTNRNKYTVVGAVASLSVFLFGATGSLAASSAKRQGPPPPPLGGPLPGLSANDLGAFNEGLNQFITIERKADGLGPVFNGESCGQCHARGAPGGAGFDLTLTRVTRIGGIRGGAYSDLEDVGGPVIQRRSLREFDPRYRIPGEIVPPGTQFVSHRITTPLFGAGLIEAIPESTILARTTMNLPDGVKGTANYELNPITNKLEVGRFGWKCQHSTLTVFAADAYLNEMGITNVLFPHENLPQGKPLKPGDDVVADPEDLNDVAEFATFMRFLAPAAPLRLSQNGQRGQALFTSTGCANCHVPTMMTGTNATPALSNKPANLYSDLLVHHMGSQLDDGVIQGRAKGDMWRTAPLWGLKTRILFLHDGRATNLNDAIKAHGGEAEKSRQRWDALKKPDRDALNEFLSSL